MSFASEGQLLPLLSSFVHVEHCSKVSINSLVNTKYVYKNEDSTPPCFTPRDKLNQFDCIWLTTTELYVSLIIDQHLTRTLYLYSV